MADRNLQVGAAFRMTKPPYLGKYYSLQNVRFIHSVIVQNWLYFANPGDFNDPFEMNPALYRPKVFKPVLPASKTRRSLDAMKIVFEKFWREQQEKLKRSGVCCFTEQFDDVIMWAHYADKHTGICLVFATDYKFFENIKSVQYIPKRLQMPILEKKDSSRLIQLMISKLKLWSYEKEWRLFRRYCERRYKYPRSALRAIIFGCRCAPEDRDLIQRLARDRKLKFYEARMSQYEYKLNIVEIQ